MKTFFLFIIRRLFKHNKWVSLYFAESLKKDKDFILTAVQENLFTLLYADDSLKKDEKIVRVALQKSGSVFEEDIEGILKSKWVLSIKH
ncbi:hypothetical protein PN36_29825 [Candidatus Thiomargarita nelsonii]|uniref:DUF4116 domain-containing protein n=1 Tax=Candidatus Thiomargarita nelsonii TaxID=1003181 RepID=A0A0A6P8Q3_9GAMM|nr:hypothetical protein PN36_29825 [Candidatus Thiomargarita nelsonii]